jgi:hypothetical protein
LYVGQREECVAMAEELGIRSRREDIGKAVVAEEKTRWCVAREFFLPRDDEERGGAGHKNFQPEDDEVRCGSREMDDGMGHQTEMEAT